MQVYQQFLTDVSFGLVYGDGPKCRHTLELLEIDDSHTLAFVVNAAFLNVDCFKIRLEAGGETKVDVLFLGVSERTQDFGK